MAKPFSNAKKWTKRVNTKNNNNNQTIWSIDSRVCVCEMFVHVKELSRVLTLYAHRSVYAIFHPIRMSTLHRMKYLDTQYLHLESYEAEKKTWNNNM